MPSIGETLRNARLQKKATEEAVAKVLKIKIEKLKDLEENRFDRFAAPVYVRSFIRNYANYLQIDSKALVEQYEKEFPAPARQPIFDVKEDTRAHTFVRHQPPAKAQGMALTSTGKAVLVASIGLVLIAVISLVVLSKAPSTSNKPLSNSNNNETDGTTPSTSPSSSGTPVASTPPGAHTNAASSEPLKIPVTPKLDTALTYSTNSNPNSIPPSTPATPPTSLPGQAVHVQ